MAIVEFQVLKTYTVNGRVFEHGLYSADDECDHNVIGANGGGRKCTKCTGWFCY